MLRCLFPFSRFFFPGTSARVIGTWNRGDWGSQRSGVVQSKWRRLKKSIEFFVFPFFFFLTFSSFSSFLWQHCEYVTAGMGFFLLECVRLGRERKGERESEWEAFGIGLRGGAKKKELVGVAGCWGVKLGNSWF